jgi:hypothetical protein
MAAPTSVDLGALLGQDFSDGGEGTDQAVAVLTIVSAMASSYTRGRGFTAGVPNDEIKAVILTASARLISNTTGLLYDEGEGPSQLSYRSAFSGWTVAELFVLNRYRVTAL